MRRVGIDVGVRAPHRAVVYDDTQAVGRPFRVEKTREAFDDLTRRALVGAPDGAIEVVMEPTGLGWLPLAAEFSRLGHHVFAPRPQKTAAFRKFLTPHAKSDNNDAAVLAQVRHSDPKGVPELRVPSAAQTMLRMSTKQRARWVDEAAESDKRIQGWLVLGNPHLAQALTGDVTSALGIAVLRQFVDPFRVRPLGQAGFAAVLAKEAGRKSASETRCAAVFAACEATCMLYAPLREAGQLPFDYDVLQELVTSELDRIAQLRSLVENIETVIRGLYLKLDPDAILERELPGIGPAIAPVIEAFAGDIGRFTNVKQYASHCGVVTRTDQSGMNDGKSRQPMTKCGQPLLRRYLFLAAGVARSHDPDMAAAYKRAIDNGHHHYSAVNIVAHRLVRRIYAILREREAAREANAQGLPVTAPSYRLTAPGSSDLLSGEEARQYVRAHFPSKATLARAKLSLGITAPTPRVEAAEAQAVISGSSLDATIGPSGPPPQAVSIPELEPASPPRSGADGASTPAPSRPSSQGLTQCEEPVGKSVGKLGRKSDGPPKIVLAGT